MGDRGERLRGLRGSGDGSTDSGRGKGQEWTEGENETFQKRTATGFAHKVEIGASLRGKIDILTCVSIVAALKRVVMVGAVVKLVLILVSSALQSEIAR